MKLDVLGLIIFLCMDVDSPTTIRQTSTSAGRAAQGRTGDWDELCSTVGWKNTVDLRAVQHLSLQPKAQVVIIKVCHVSQQSFLLAKSDTAWWFETVPKCLAQLRVSTEHGIDIPQTHKRFVTGHLGAVAKNRTYISLFQTLLARVRFLQQCIVQRCRPTASVFLP